MTQQTTIAIDDHVPLPEDCYYDLQRDSFFDPYRIPKGENAKHIVRRAIQLIHDHEQSNSLRKRARRKANLHTFEQTVSAVLSDVMSAELAQPGQTLAIPLSKQVLQELARYRPTALNSKTSYLVKTMARLGLLDMEIGRLRLNERKHFRTVIWAGPTLLNLMADHPVRQSDFGRHVTGECIILKDEKVDYWDTARFQPYDDTDLTRQLRSEVEQINEWIAHASIDVITSELTKTIDIDTSDTHLRRYFTRSSFESGGRLFGVLWMSLPKQHRLRAIRIDGERVVGLDYAQMAPRILYGLCEAPVSLGDLYAIDGIDPRYRDGVKKLFNAMIFATKPLTRKPKNSSHLLPKSKVEHLSKLVMQAHPLIAHQFHTGIGHKTQFIESQVMMRVLLTLKDQGIVGLPIHDGLLVPESAGLIAKGVMERAAQELAHIAVPVAQEK